MPQGLQVFDAGGSLIIDVSDRLAKFDIEGSFYIPPYGAQGYEHRIAVPGITAEAYCASASILSDQTWRGTQMCSAIVDAGYIVLTHSYIDPACGVGSTVRYRGFRF